MAKIPLEIKISSNIQAALGRIEPTLRRIDKQLESLTAATKKIGKGFEQSNKSIAKTAISLNKAASAVAKVANANKGLTNRFESTAKAVGKLSNNLQKASKNSGRVAKDLAKVSGSKIVSGFTKLAAASAAAATAFAAFAAVKGFVGIAKAAADAESASISFQVLIGNADLAKKTLADLYSFAATTPFEIGEVEKGAKELLATGAGAGELVNELTILGNAAAALGVDLSRLTQNFGQVRTNQRLTGQELRDFLRAGIPLISELSKQLGVSEASIRDMVSAGKIGFDDVKRSFQALSSEGGQLANLLEFQAQTVGGLFSNLKDSITLLFRDIGTQVAPQLRGILTGFIKLLEDPKIRGALISFGEALANIFTTAVRVGIPLFIGGMKLVANQFRLFINLLIKTRDLFSSMIEKVNSFLPAAQQISNPFEDGAKKAQRLTKNIEELNAKTSKNLQGRVKQTEAVKQAEDALADALSRNSAAEARQAQRKVAQNKKILGSIDKTLAETNNLRESLKKQIAEIPSIPTDLLVKLSLDVGEGEAALEDLLKQVGDLSGAFGPIESATISDRPKPEEFAPKGPKVALPSEEEAAVTTKIKNLSDLTDVLVGNFGDLIGGVFDPSLYTSFVKGAGEVAESFTKSAKAGTLFEDGAGLLFDAYADASKRLGGSVKELASSIAEAAASFGLTALTATVGAVKNNLGAFSSAGGTTEENTARDTQLASIRQQIAAKQAGNVLNNAKEILELKRQEKALAQEQLAAQAEQAEVAKNAAFDVVKDVASQIPVFGEAIAGVLDLLKDPEAVAGLLDALTEALPGVIDALIDSVPQVVDSFVKNIPKIIDTLVDKIPELIIALIRAAPKLITALVKKIPDIIRGFVAALPEIIDALVDAIPEIIEGIIIALPEIITALAEAMPKVAIALAVGVIKVIPKIAKALLDALLGGLSKGVGGIFNTITDALFPKTKGGGVEKDFAEGIEGVQTPGKAAVDLDPSKQGAAKRDSIVQVEVETPEEFEKKTGVAIDPKTGKAILPGLATGGFVLGTGNKDTVPALLTPGEIVIDRSTGPQLRSFLNDQQKPQQNEGNSELLIVLSQILAELQQPQQVSTSVNVDGNKLAEAILELHRNGARLA